MENARREHRIGLSLEHRLREVLEVASAARGDDRHTDGFGHSARQPQIEAVARAVAVHAGEQDFARARRLHALRPVDGIDPGRSPPAVGVDLPASAVALGVDRDDDALVADDAGGVAHQFR